MMGSDEWIILFRNLARACSRHRRKSALFFLAVILATAGYTLMSPAVYRAQAKLFVRLGRENATLDPTATMGQAPVVVASQSRDTEINIAAEILRSRFLLEKVVDAVGPHEILGQRAPIDGGSRSEAAGLCYRAVAKLIKAVEVEPSKRSNVVAVTYDGPSPEVAEAVVSKILEVFRERHMQLNRTPGARQFLADQTTRQKAALTRAEEELGDVKNATGLIFPEGQRQLLVARLGRLQDEVLQTDGAVAAIEAEVRMLREKLAGLAPTHVTARTSGVRNEAADNMHGQLYTLQLRELELRSKYPEGHPDIDRLREQTAAARAILHQEDREREQVTEGPNRVFEETQLALLRQEPLLTSLRAKADALQAQLARQHSELQAFNKNSLRVVRLERAIGLEESHYRRYAENLEQAQIDGALEAERISNISILQPANCDPNPVRPRPLINFSIGLLLAVIGAVGLAIVAEQMNPARLHE